jgi:xylan 1,4-beta-xylosidase
MKPSLLVFVVIMISTVAWSQSSSGITTWCNPVDLNYRYNFEQLNDSISYRSGADPVIVNHKGEYFLFVTISGGYWHSKDLLHWRYIVPDKWPMEDMCAPAAMSVRDTLYLFQSTFLQRPIFVSTEPEKGKLIFYNRWLPQLPKDIGPWDPAMFYDEDLDKWYMYWGSSNVYPIFGAELDKKRRLTYMDKADYRSLIYLHPDKYGWERFGRDHRDTIKPFTEGAWMTKHDGKYYLQYGAPGTEFNVYANGTYVGDHPLGPFTYAPYNPISYKPGGFVNGAGHGNTFQDNYGNYWNTGTPWIAVNWNFERRIAMFPTAFDPEGDMHASTRFGDFPHLLPTKKFQSPDELFTGWMLLSYRKTVTASSSQKDHDASLLTDENPRTFWVAEKNSPDQWVTLDLGSVCNIRALQINFTDYKSNIYDSDSTVVTRFRVHTSRDNKTWELVGDLSKEKTDRSNPYIELEQPTQARYVRYEHVYSKTPNLAISDIRVFGKGNMKAPATPVGVTVKRDKDTRNAFVEWKKVPGVVGYNVRWGIKPDKLYQAYQVFNDQPSLLEIRALTKDQDYYFAVEAFNENGVSAVSKVLPCPVASIK